MEITLRCLLEQETRLAVSKVTSAFNCLGCGSLGPALSAAGATLQYLQETQKISLGHIRRLTRLSDSDRVVLDRSTQLSLELTRTLREGARKVATLHREMDRARRERLLSLGFGEAEAETMLIPKAVTG